MLTHHHPSQTISRKKNFAHSPPNSTGAFSRHRNQKNPPNLSFRKRRPKLHTETRPGKHWRISGIYHIEKIEQLRLLYHELRGMFPWGMFAEPATVDYPVVAWKNHPQLVTTRCLSMGIIRIRDEGELS